MSNLAYNLYYYYTFTHSHSYTLRWTFSCIKCIHYCILELANRDHPLLIAHIRSAHSNSNTNANRICGFVVRIPQSPTQLPLQSIQMFHLCSRMPCVPQIHIHNQTAHSRSQRHDQVIFPECKIDNNFSVREQLMQYADLLHCTGIGMPSVFFPAGHRDTGTGKL